MVGGGFEPPKLSRQIYSLIPLAAREPHQTQILITPPDNSAKFDGAGERSRTPDLLITSQLLYQLSYTSFTQIAQPNWLGAVEAGFY